MPSIAGFIKELLSEDKYSGDYSDRILDRITVMNAAQLQGIYNHLQLTSKTSKSDLWIQANIELMSRIEGILKERTAEQQKINKIIEEAALKEQQKIKKQIENNKEKKRVMRMIVENARSIAIQEVKENEMKRQSDEKLEIMQKVFQGEERRNKWWRRTAFSFVISIVLICVFLKNIIYVIVGILFVLIVTVIVIYKASKFTTVLPRVVDESELELQISKKEEVLKKKAVDLLREKEKKFQEQLLKDKEDKKKRKELKRNRQLFEQQLMLNRSQAQSNMANEALQKKATHIIEVDKFIISNHLDEDKHEDSFDEEESNASLIHQQDNNNSNDDDNNKADNDHSQFEQQLFNADAKILLFANDSSIEDIEDDDNINYKDLTEHSIIYIDQDVNINNTLHIENKTNLDPEHKSPRIIPRDLLSSSLISPRTTPRDVDSSEITLRSPRDNVSSGIFPLKVVYTIADHDDIEMNLQSTN